MRVIYLLRSLSELGLLNLGLVFLVRKAEGPLDESPGGAHRLDNFLTFG